MRRLLYPSPQDLFACTDDLVPQVSGGPLLYAGPVWHLCQEPFLINIIVLVSTSSWDPEENSIPCLWSGISDTFLGLVPLR